MDKRRSRRLKVNLKAERISGSGSHAVFIENISEQGILMVVPHSTESRKFHPGTDVDLKLRLSSGKAIDLTCKVRWSCLENPPDGVTDSIGLEVIDPPLPYRNFVRVLH